MIYIVLNNSPKYHGGVEQVVNNLLTNFSNEFKSNLILICNDQKEKKKFIYRGVFCINLKTRRFPNLDKLILFSRLSYSYKIFKFLKKELKDGDVINVQGIEYNFFVSLFKKLIKIQFIYTTTIHGSFFEEYTQYVVKTLPLKYLPVKLFFYFFRWYFYFLERASSKNVDYFIFINKYFRNYFNKQYNVAFNKGTVIYNGINVSDRYYRKNKKNADFTGLIVGSTVYRKGLDYAIEIVNKFNKSGHNLKLRIVGFPDFYKYFNKDKLNNNIEYIGVVPHDKIAKHYKDSDFLLFPSRYEGFPLSVLEALQFNLPCLVSNVCSANEIPDFNKFGYVLNNYYLADWLKFLDKITDLKKYNELLENIRKSNMSNFDWRKIAKDYENIFLVLEKTYEIY